MSLTISKTSDWAVALMYCMYSYIFLPTPDDLAYLSTGKPTVLSDYSLSADFV